MTKHLVKGLGLIVLVIIASCQPQRLSNVDIISVEQSQINGKITDLSLKNACENWMLSYQQVKHFFLLSEEFDSNPYSEFYQLPCSIHGELVSNGEKWSFTINAGATAKWTKEHSNQIKYFACKS